MADPRISITKLTVDGSNRVTYRDRLVWIFGTRHWSLHLSEQTLPAAYTAAGNINGLTPQERWDSEEDFIKELISTSVPDHIFRRIKTKTNVHDVWTEITSVHQTRSKMITIDLDKQFQATKLGDTADPRIHFEKLEEMRERLASMGKSFTDEEFAAILLGSLPQSYEQTINALNATADVQQAGIPPDRVIRLVNDEYDRRIINQGGSPSGPEEALAANLQKCDKRNVKCYNCHKKGHYKSECWAKGGDQEGQRLPRSSNDQSAPNTENRNRRNNRGNRNNRNNQYNRRNSDNAANSADIEAWAAIEEVEGYPTDHIVSSAIPLLNQPRIEAELYDSGASRHMSPFGRRFLNYRPIPPRAITAANKKVFYAIGTGDLEIEVPLYGNCTTPVLLRDTLHAPDMAMTVVSIGRITSAGNSVTFDNQLCSIRNKSGNLIGRVPASSNGLFKVEHQHSILSANAGEPINIHTLHRNLGHIAADTIRSLIKDHAIEGIELTDDGSPIICDSCNYAKMTRKPIKHERSTPSALQFGEEIHTDLWGPSPVASLGGRRYYITFTDDATRYTRINILRNKSDALESYRALTAWAHTQHGVKIKTLRSDRGGEYTGRAFTLYLQQEGTERRLTTHDTPQHNGVAEALNRRLLERVRAMLHQSGLSKNLWAEAVRHAVWLKNRTSTRALGKSTTPFEKLYGHKPILANVPEWGQVVWIHSGTGSKLDARGIEARWVGFDEESTHAYRIYWPQKNSVTVERNVKFSWPIDTLMNILRMPAPRSQAQAPAALPAPPPTPPAPPTPHRSPSPANTPSPAHSTTPSIPGAMPPPRPQPPCHGTPSVKL